MLEEPRYQEAREELAAADRPHGRQARVAMTGVEADPRDPSVLPLVAWAQLLAWYHRHRVVGLGRLGEQLRAGRRVVLVGNHALDLVDPLLFVTAVLKRYGRIPRFIGHENFVFNIPVLREVAQKWRVIPSRAPDAADEALHEDGFLMLFPGSGTEALMRDYRREPYTLKWAERTGFLRLALEHDAQLMFVAAVGNDDMYYQSRIRLPDLYMRWINAGDADRYRGARMQLGLFGPHLLPALGTLPVQITHVVCDPIGLGDRVAASASEEALSALHGRVWAECQRFLDEAVQACHERASWLDRAVRAATRAVRATGL